MIYGTRRWVWAFWMAGVVAGVLAMVPCRMEAGETNSVTVGPGTNATVTFSATGANPVWSLTVTPESGWKHTFVSVNSSRWTIESPGGDCKEKAKARFMCDTATELVELQFHDRVFSGQLAPCEDVGVGEEHEADWTVTAATLGNYRVMPESTNICLSSSAIFRAEDFAGNPVDSSWASTLSLGTLSTGTSVTVTPASPGVYYIAGTPLADPSLTDAGKLTVIKVEVAPNKMTVIESLDSEPFTCTVTPSGLSSTYKWLTGASNGAWPATAGNSPQLDYSAVTASSTIVKKTGASGFVGGFFRPKA